MKPPGRLISYFISFRVIKYARLRWARHMYIMGKGGITVTIVAVNHRNTWVYMREQRVDLKEMRVNL